MNRCVAIKDRPNPLSAGPRTIAIIRVSGPDRNPHAHNQTGEHHKEQGKPNISGSHRQNHFRKHEADAGHVQNAYDKTDTGHDQHERRTGFTGVNQSVQPDFGMSEIWKKNQTKQKRGHHSVKTRVLSGSAR